MTSKTFDELDKGIRTQGLVGLTVLLVTLFLFVYRSGTVEGTRYTSVAETARVALQNAQSDLQGLFDGRVPEHDISLLKRRARFGWDFVPAWMVFIFFLQREILKCRPGRRRAQWVALFILMFTLTANRWVDGYIATAERQAVTDAELNRIIDFGQIKWILLFFDAFLAGLQLYLTPPILRVGAIIMAASAVAGFGSVGVPVASGVGYAIMGIFLAFSGVCTLLLFHPQLLYGERS